MKHRNKSVRRMSALLLLVCLTPLSLIAQVAGREGGQVTIKRLTLAAERSEGPQPCPAVLRFHGIIEASTDGQVRYRWRTSRGEATPYATLNLNAGEAREVVHTRRVGGAGGETSRGWLVLEVAAAGGTKTARAPFEVECRGGATLDGGTTAGLSSGGLRGMATDEGEGEENLLERFENLYLRKRGYSLEDSRDDKRLRSLERLREMRRLQRKIHVGAGWADTPGGVSAPGTVDASNCAWSSTGPTNINGRVTHIAVDPTNGQRLFVTSVGGVWRSTDGARRWQRVSDDFLSTVFASVAVNPSTPSEVFVGGGDPNYHNTVRGGLGIWRSTADGDPGSWSKVSPPELDNQVIYRLRIDTASPNNVYAATSNGVYIGTRSGSSITFARLGAFNAWANDIAVDFSVTPRLVYAGVRQASGTFGRGIWKYNGTTWNQRNTGIPTASSQTIVLALARSNPSILYAKVESNDGHSQGVYKTTTAGETPMGGGNAWAATGSALDDSCAGTFCYSWYNSVLEVNPTDANTVWGGGLSIYRTTNGGTNWTNVWNGTDASYPLGVHADHHAVAFDPSNSNIVYVGNDGGIFRTGNTGAATWHWNNVAHNMVITEFYRASSQHALAGIAAGGTQDNGTLLTFSNRVWYQPGGCDGNDAAIDAANASTLYGYCNGTLSELTNPVPGTVGGGSQATWTLPAGVTLVTPLVTDPGVAGGALSGGYTTSGTTKTWRLVKTTDGLNWSNASPTLTPPAQISAIGIAPSTSFQTYYVGVSGGAVWRTTNGGGLWTQTSSGIPPGAWVSAVAVDNANPARAVAATSNGIYLTTDTGANWNTIAGTGAVALPTNAITGAVFDPNDANVVYAVTDVGAFRGTITPAIGTAPPSGNWTPFDEGLPDGMDINDVWINRTTGMLKIGTMGHGAYQRDVRPGITCPAARLIVRDNINDQGELPSVSGVPDPEHPIPDPARPGFYKPDDTSAGRLYWWTSADVRIDVPSSAPVMNQIASADHVEMQTCPVRLSSCPAGTLLDANPQRGQAARVYAQVTNAGLQPATNVRVVALVADASAGLPLLPADFWTTTFPAGSTTCGALDTSTGWRFASPSNPCPIIPVVNPEVPEVARYDWTVPLGQAEHSCMLIISESASDPLDPNVRSANERRLWELVPNNRQISLRNLHVVNAPPAPQGGAPSGFESMGVPNPGISNDLVELVFSRVDFPADAVLGVLLPTNAEVTARGAKLERLSLGANQRGLANELQLNTDAFYRVTDEREAVLRLPIPPGSTWRVGVVYDAGKLREGATAQWSVIARQGSTIFGGNTYYIRPNPSATPQGTGNGNNGGVGNGTNITSGFFSLGLRAGAAFPHGFAGNFFDPGPAATVDLEYHAADQISVAGLFGYRRFSGQGFVPSLNLYELSVGPKAYLTSGVTRPFVNAGVGAFKFGSGSTNFGAYGGGGIQFRFRPRIWVEGEYEYHTVFTSGSNFNFSTVQGGLRFRF